MKPTVPNELLSAIARGDSIPFVGSGPSMLAGFPGWRRLIELMLDWCGRYAIPVPNQSDIERLIDSPRLLLAAEALRTNMGDSKYYEFLREVFDKPSVPLTEFHHLLPQIPFAGTATTNYETLVERAFRNSKSGEPIKVFTQVDYEELGTVLNSKQFFVLKAHGTIERVETIVLGQKDYATLIHKSVGYRTFLRALFLDRTILFLGFGLNDPDLRLLLEELREIFQGQTPMHYALLDVSNMTETEQKNFESHYGIRVIPYTPSSPDHPEVLEFLLEIIAKLPKFIIAHTMTTALKPAKTVLNADSHYRLVMNTDNEFSLHEKYEGASKEKPLMFSVSFHFDRSKEADREAHEALKKLFSEGEPVTLKTPHLAKFVPPEILSPLMPDIITEMQVTLGPAKDDKVLVVRAVIEPNDGPSVTLENIALKKIRGGNEQAILSNEDQEVPWKLRQVIKFKQNLAETEFKFDFVDIPIKQALRLEKFCEALSYGGYLTIELEENDFRLGRSKIEAGAFAAPDRRVIQLLEALEIIQRKTGEALKSPHAVPVDEANHILTVAKIVETGTASMLPPEMNFTVKEVQEILPKFEEGVTMSIQNYADGWVSRVLGKEIHLGPVLISCDRLTVTPADRAEAMKRIEGQPLDHVISMRLSPVDDSVIEAKYIAWLPSAEADGVRNTPIVRTTSLNNLLSLLFDATIDTKGLFEIEEFMKLLADARAESTEEEVELSPLSLATAHDLTQAFELVFQRLDAERCVRLKARLVEDGWLGESSDTSSSAKDAAA